MKQFSIRFTEGAALNTLDSLLIQLSWQIWLKLVCTKKSLCENLQSDWLVIHFAFDMWDLIPCQSDSAFLLYVRQAQWVKGKRILKKRCVTNNHLYGIIWPSGHTSRTNTHLCFCAAFPPLVANPSLQKGDVVRDLENRATALVVRRAVKQEGLLSFSSQCSNTGPWRRHKWRRIAYDDTSRV